MWVPVFIALVSVAGLVACQPASGPEASEVADFGSSAAVTVPMPESGNTAEPRQAIAAEPEAGAGDRFAAGNREFAFVAFERLLADSESEDHLLFSPHSVLAALAMVYAGSDGSTREQMRSTLRFALDGPALHEAFAALQIALVERSRIEREDAARGFELTVVNRLWGQQDFGFLPGYLADIERHYGAGLEPVDFANQPEAARLDVNAWVEEQTRERIRDLLPQGSVRRDTRLILVNAIHFLASWQDAFNTRMTRDQAFVTGAGAVVEVPMMRRVATMPVRVDAETAAISLPYLGGDVSLLALMPATADADFDTWLARLDRERFDAVVADLAPRRVALEFPRFSGGGGFRLSKLLRDLGMPLAFSPSEADFRGMNGVGPGVPGRSLHIDEVFHQTFIDLDEAGTEAAAATAVVMMRQTAMVVEEEALELRFDRPFVYAIHDHPTNTILFLGRVLNPLPAGG